MTECVRGALVELYWQGRSDECGEKPVLHQLDWGRTQTSAAVNWELTTWAMTLVPFMRSTE